MVVQYRYLVRDGIGAALSYSSLSKISIISAAVITCGSFGKCLRLPVIKKESSLLRQTS